MPYLDSPVRGHPTLEGALEAIFDKLEGMGERLGKLDGMGERLEKLDGMGERLEKLEGYVRNHLTTKVDAIAEDVQWLKDKQDETLGRLDTLETSVNDAMNLADQALSARL